MTARRQSALREMAARGGSPNEQAIAREALKTFPAIRPEEADDVWMPSGILTRHRKGAKAYMRQDALAYFLKKIQDGSEFSYKSIPYTDDFGSGDFYLIISWLLFHELVVKMPRSMYVVPSKAATIKAWNAAADDMKIK